MRLVSQVTEVLGSRPVVSMARLATNRRVRVLAYHDVTDPVAFCRQLDVIQEHYRPVTGAEVATAVRGRHEPPNRAVWLTFDDAHSGVLKHALPLLVRRRVPATLFVCPGVVDTQRPYWWQVLEAAVAHGRSVEFGGRTWSHRSIITHLKKVPDATRRAAVARIAAELAEAGDAVTVRQATSAELLEWLNAGLELGNHTWDHPCLDTCGEEQQRQQIIAADDWLREMAGRPVRLFAYPNGSVTVTSRRVVAERGYAVSALFDHRIARLGNPELSRLRVDSDASVRRFSAIVSGAHPAAFAVARRLRATRETTGAVRCHTARDSRKRSRTESSS